MSLQSANASAALIAALLSGLLASLCWRYRQREAGLLPLGGALWVSAIWLLVAGLRELSTSPELWLLWTRFAFAAELLLPPLWLMFAMSYTGYRRWDSRRLHIGLTIEPAVMVLIVLPALALPSAETSQVVPLVQNSEGLLRIASHLLWVHHAYTLGLLMVAAVLLLHHALKHRARVPGQHIPLVAGACLPLLAGILNPIHPLLWAGMPLTPATMGITGLVLFGVLFRLELPDPRPVARDKVIRALEDGVLVLDAEQRILDLNPAAVHILNASPEALLGKPLPVTLRPSQPGDPTGREISLATAAGRRQFSLHSLPLDLQGGLDGTEILLLRDITASRQAEAALRSAQDEAATASRLKTEFMATVSHELRTPLNAIIGYSDLLTQGIYGALNPLQTDRVVSVHRSGQHMLEVVNNILEITRLDADPVEPALEPVELPMLIEQCLPTVRPLVEAKSLELRVEVAPDLPPVLANGRRLCQVMKLLVDNAIKFTPDGSITVQAMLLNNAGRPYLHRGLPPQPDGWVLLSVADTGIGMSPQSQARLFEPFHQADGSATRLHEGTGLGLALAYRLVTLMRGIIRVESAPGAGSTFFVLFPAAPVPPPLEHIRSESVPTGEVDPAISYHHAQPISAD